MTKPKQGLEFNLRSILIVFIVLLFSWSTFVYPTFWVNKSGGINFKLLTNIKPNQTYVDGFVADEWRPVAENDLLNYCTFNSNIFNSKNRRLCQFNNFNPLVKYMNSKRHIIVSMHNGFDENFIKQFSNNYISTSMQHAGYVINFCTNCNGEQDIDVIVISGFCKFINCEINRNVVKKNDVVDYFEYSSGHKSVYKKLYEASIFTNTKFLDKYKLSTSSLVDDSETLIYSQEFDNGNYSNANNSKFFLLNKSNNIDNRAICLVYSEKNIENTAVLASSCVLRFAAPSLPIDENIGTFINFDKDNQSIFFVPKVNFNNKKLIQFLNNNY